ncbi:MAG TPA: archease [Candidatus Atribacteria bacterium]|nr:archease [Candidatus Atribacteria bacterium]
MKEFEIIEHTADIGIVAYGKNKKEVFINAAKGMFDIITGGNITLKEDFYDKIELEADNLEGLFFVWLNELLYISETKLVILNKFEIKDLSNNKISVEVRGMTINQLDRKIEKEIKAVTYHRLEIKKDEESGLWRAQVIFDI